jgi:hypothetical protein
MKKNPNQILAHEVSMTEPEFLESFNKNMPAGYPHVTHALLMKFKEAHPGLFKDQNIWTLDHHRKRLIEWLPQNIQ